MAEVGRWVRRRLSRTAPPSLRLLAKSIVNSRTGGPVVGVPAARSAVVVGAHPDDETAMAGGSLALLAASGCRIGGVVASRGEASRGAGLSPQELGDARVRDLLAASEILGVNPPRVLQHPDGGLATVISDLAQDFTSFIREFDPEIVFVPWWLDGHSDHRAVAHAVAAADLPMSTIVWAGEIWTPLVPNRVVDISGVIELKERALQAHATAGAAFSLSAFLGLSRYRSLSGLGGRGYAEGFIALDFADFRRAVESDGE